MKKIYLILLLLPAACFSQARHESWSRVSASYRVNSRWTAEADFQYRTQSDFKKEDKNIFHYGLGYSARLWAYYQLPKNWKLIISPVGYFVNNLISGESNTIEKRKDTRIMTGIGKAFVMEKWFNKNRFLYEIAFIDFPGNTSNLQTRYRLLNNFTYPFSKKTALKNTAYYFANEIFFQTTKGKTIFNQNRVYNALLWNNKKMEVTAGYQWVVQKDKSTFFRNQLLITIKIVIGNTQKAV